MPDDKTLPSIAVVAVHGVGEHERGASARSIADLLLRLRYGDADAQYTSFRENALRIPTRPVVVAPQPATTKRNALFDELSHYLRDVLASPEPALVETMPSRTELPPAPPLDAATGRPSARSSGGRWGRYAPEYDFMRGQLEGYCSTGDPYDTLRLEGHPLSPSSRNEPAHPTAVVHIYEMYWSDLSRLGTSLLSIFGELYQLLFHVAHLSRQAVEHALVEHKDERRWQWYASLTQWAVRLLTVFVPVSWLTMLTTVLGILVLAVPADRKPLVVAIIAGLAVSGTVWRMAYRGATRFGFTLWPLIPLSGSVIGFALWWWTRAEWNDHHPAHADRLMLFAWMSIAGILLLFTYRGYQKLRPGVLAIGMGAYAVALVATIWIMWTDSPSEMSARTTNVFEIETIGVVVIWYSLYLVATIAALLGIFNRWRLYREVRCAAPGDVARCQRRLERASQVGWTARTTIAISAASVLLLTFVLWAATLEVSNAVVPQALAQPYTPIVPRFFGGPTTYEHFFATVLGTTAGAGFPIVLMVMTLLGLVLLLAFLPAVLQELSAPRAGEQFEARPNATAPSPDEEAKKRADAWVRDALEGDRAERLGSWLTVGYAVLTLSVVLLFVAVFILQPTASIVHWMWPNAYPVLGALQRNAHDLILTLGTLLATTSVSVIVVSKRLEKLALGFRPMLDAALDVDNYLREHPRNRTPRARIAERYVSLLRYLTHWRDGNDQPYRAIVIVSHSQGTVISADLFGLLQVERDPELAGAGTGSDKHGPPILLFTMGSPLRQLYGFSFPHLYRWIRDPAAAWGGRPRAGTRPARFGGATPSDAAHVVTPPFIADDAVPDPADLGLLRWVNAYRSGDYVGRPLWRPELPDCTWVHRASPGDAQSRLAHAAAAGEPVTFVTEDRTGSRRELCLGAGAHTHYWDATARAVALELDRLIRDGLTAPSPPVVVPKTAIGDRLNAAPASVADVQRR